MVWTAKSIWGKIFIFTIGNKRNNLQFDIKYLCFFGLHELASYISPSCFTWIRVFTKFYCQKSLKMLWIAKKNSLEISKPSSSAKTYFCEMLEKSILEIKFLWKLIPRRYEMWLLENCQVLWFQWNVWVKSTNFCHSFS